MGIALLALAAAITGPPTQETTQAFSHYASLVEADFQRSQPFLDLDSDPQAKRRVLNGQIVVLPRAQSRTGKPLSVPNALIHDWYGAVFLPCTLETATRILQDYANYKKFYQPEVTESKLLSRHDGDFRVFLQLSRAQILTVVLNGEYDVHYRPEGANRLRIVSRSARIAEVSSGKELSADEAYGFLWRLNSYWSLEAVSGGVIAECRALSLSRDIPTGLGWLLQDFVKKFPRESMQHTLDGTRRAVRANLVTAR